MSIVALKRKINAKNNISKRSGFYLNGTKNVNGIVQKDKKPGCCSDDGTSIKRSVTGTKGMLDSKKYRNENCCLPSEEEKMCDKKAFKHIEKMNTSASHVTENKKRKNEICANLICVSPSNPPSQNCCQCTDDEKAMRPSWCRHASKSVHINHSNKTAMSSSDYLLHRKLRNQVKITTTDQTINSICPDPVQTYKTHC